MNKLSDDQVTLISAKLPISENKYIVLIDMSGDKKSLKKDVNSNIYCVDGNGNIFWQVNNSNGMFERDSFVNVEDVSNTLLSAKRFFGKKYLINKSSGFSEEVGWDK